MRSVAAGPAAHGDQGRRGDHTSKPKADGPLVAQVFKTRIDPFVQKLSFIRIFSGTLKKDENVPRPARPARGSSMGPAAAQSRPTRRRPSTRPGRATSSPSPRWKTCTPARSLGDYRLPAIKFPTPMVGLAVSPKSRGDETKLSGALHKIAEEDPTIRIDRDPQTKELVMTGMSELHLTIIRERLHRRDKLEVETKEPKIPFRETIQATGRRHVPPQEADRRPRPVRRSPHPHVPAAARHEHRGVRHQGPVPAA